MERKDCKRNAPDRIDITMYDGTNMSIPCKYANSIPFTKKQIGRLALGLPVRTTKDRLSGNAYVQIKPDKNGKLRLLNVSEKEANAYVAGIRFAKKQLQNNQHIPEIVSEKQETDFEFGE